MYKESKPENIPKKHVSKCTICGMCRNVCPITRVCNNEYKSPRAKAILRKNGVVDSVTFDCTLCMACEHVCPINIDFEHLEARKQLVRLGQSPEANKELLENVKKYGNPFGKVEKGEKPKKLYCC